MTIFWVWTQVGRLWGRLLSANINMVTSPLNSFLPSSHTHALPAAHQKHQWWGRGRGGGWDGGGGVSSCHSPSPRGAGIPSAGGLSPPPSLPPPPDTHTSPLHLPLLSQVWLTEGLRKGKLIAVMRNIQVSAGLCEASIALSCHGSVAGPCCLADGEFLFKWKIYPAIYILPTCM